MNQRKFWATLCALTILGVVYWIGFAEAQGLQAGTHITLNVQEAPRVVADSKNDRQEQPSEEWLTYENETGGYSFSYPATYTVTENSLGRSGVRPLVVDHPGGIVGFHPLAYELDDVADDLVEWVDLYNHYHGEPVHPKASSTDFAHLQKERAQQVLIQTPETSPIYVYGFLFTNGKLVWRLFTNSTDEADKQLVDKIAKTVQFSENAPTDMQALYAPDEAPMISSVADMKEFHREGELVKEAYQIRIDTGETPAELLAQMSERARRYYEVTLENNAPAIRAHDEQRASPPPVVEYTEEHYQSYLKSEADYAKGMLVPTTPEDGGREDTAQIKSGEFQQYLPGLFRESSSTNTPFQVYDFADAQSSPRSTDATHALCDGAGLFPTLIIDRRRGMPTRFALPIRVIGRPINCGSPQHVINTGRDGYAIDISVVVGIDVYGVTQNELVYALKNNWTVSEGKNYGNFVRSRVSLDTGGVLKEYHMLYAHLDTVNTVNHTYVGPSTVIAKSGDTGTYDPSPDSEPVPHLHFAVATQEGGQYYPVDLSPMKGFTPNLHYPKNCAVCGYVEDKDDGHRPIIIEANEFRNSYSGSSSPSHSWNCSQYYADKHTGFCYRAAVPITPQWGHDPINASNQHLSPRMDYELWISEAGIYRAWICGMGGTVEDDSLHMGFDDVVRQSSDRIQGFHTNQWLWASETMDNGPHPYFYLSTGYHDINVWARENGLRIDRLLLTLDHNFNPDTALVRCAGEGLYP